MRVPADHSPIPNPWLETSPGMFQSNTLRFQRIILLFQILDWNRPRACSSQTLCGSSESFSYSESFTGTVPGSRSSSCQARGRKNQICVYLFHRGLSFWHLFFMVAFSKIFVHWCILTNKRTNRQMNKQTNQQTNKQTNKQTSKQASKQTNKQTDRQTDRQTDKQTNKQTNKTNKNFFHNDTHCMYIKTSSVLSNACS